MTIDVIAAGPQQVSRSVVVNASAAELFAIVADLQHHDELDGSGTVRGNIIRPDRLVPGARFSMKMKLFGLPYRVTSTVTAVETDELIEWRLPLGHRWRWEFAGISPTRTRVTETFDYRNTGLVKDRVKFYERTGFAKRNAAGIDATLRELRRRYDSD